MANGRICLVDECGKSHYARGYCQKHYQRLTRTGVPDRPNATYNRRDESRRTGADFLRSLIGTEEAECIPWPLCRDRDGYGKTLLLGKACSASRAMCILAHGMPPNEGMQAAHSCGKGHLGCVNPNHLRWATASENHLDQFDHGTVHVGAPKKLTEVEVRKIRRLARHRGHEGIAKDFGVSTSTVSDIKTKKTWAWLR